MDEERDDAALFRLLLPGPGSVVHEDRWNIFALLYDTLKCHGHRTFCVFEFQLPGLYM